MSNLERYNKLLKYISPLSYLVIIYYYLKLWLFPPVDNASLITNYIALIGFESILILSSIFLSITWQNNYRFIILALYMIFFVYGFYSSTPSAVLYAYLFPAFYRVRYFFSIKPTEELKKSSIIYYLINLCIYIVIIFAGAFANRFIPRFGLTDQYFLASGYTVILVKALYLWINPMLPCV